MANQVEIQVTGRNTSGSAMQQAAGQARGLGNEIKSVGTIASGIIRAQVFTRLASGAKQAFTSTIAAASNLNETINAVGVTFGAAGDDVLALGDDSAQSMGLSQRAFNEAAVTVSNFAKTIAGEGGDVAGVIEQITGRASDFASVMNLDVEEALVLFRSGLAGESEPLRRYGIDVSAASVQTFAWANGIAEAGKELTEAEKVQARFGTIMEQTNDTAGDFANTSDGLANSQRIFNATLEDTQAQLGQDLIPLLEKGSGLLTKMLVGMQDWNKATADWNITGNEFAENLDRGNVQMDAFTALVLNTLGLTKERKDATEEDTRAQQTSAETLEQWSRIAENANVAGENFADVTAEMEEQASGLTDQLAAEQEQLDNLISTMFEAEGGVLDVRDAQRGLESAIDDASDAFDKNGETLDRNTQEGRDNESALDDIASSAHQLIEAQLEAGESGDTMRGSMERARKKFIETADQMGLSEEAAEDLADELGLIPSEVETTAKFRDEATRKIANLQAQLAAITRQINIRANISVSGVGGVERLAAFGTRFMASGGIVGAGSHAQEGGPRGRDVLINEARPEVVSLPDGSRVIPSLDQAFDRNQVAEVEPIATVAVIRPEDLQAFGRVLLRALQDTTFTIDDRGQGRMVARNADLLGRAG